MSTVWSIAGVDTKGYAGMHADCKTFSSLGLHGACIITAITAQNLEKISAVEYISAQHLAEQIAILDAENPPKAIKIGMLGGSDTHPHIINYLKKFKGFVVLDPVVSSTSGYSLYVDSLTQHLKQLLAYFPYVDLLTPNLIEAERLLNCKIQSYAEIVVAAKTFLSLGAKSVLIKGGHFNDRNFSQDYWTNGKEAFWLASPRVLDRQYRGSGCTLAAAVTAALSQGYTLKDSIVIGKMFINQSIRCSKAINTRLSALYYGKWPESEFDLPYLSQEPIQAHPCAFQRTKILGLYPIVNSSDWVQRLLSLGVKTIQLRIKDAQKNIEDEIKKSIAFANHHHANLFINDHWQLAIKLGAHGVHLGQDDLNEANIEAIRAAGMQLGISTHCYYEVARAHTLNPSYIACGPIYPTNSKIMPFLPQGIHHLKRWRRTLNYPLVAIGGINLSHLPELIAAGIEGIALISAITHSQNPEAETLKFLQQITQEKNHAVCE